LKECDEVLYILALYRRPPLVTQYRRAEQPQNMGQLIARERICRPDQPAVAKHDGGLHNPPGALPAYKAPLPSMWPLLVGYRIMRRNQISIHAFQDLDQLGNHRIKHGSADTPISRISVSLAILVI
jgi:hypothetical protein